jgi:hypothetical protein
MGASRGATCFHPLRSFGPPPPFSQKMGEAGWGSRLRANGQTRLSYGSLVIWRTPARATVSFERPEWISPPGCLPRTDRQVAEQRNGYLSPGKLLDRTDYMHHPRGVKVILTGWMYLKFGVSFPRRSIRTPKSPEFGVVALSYSNVWRHWTPLPQK